METKGSEEDRKKQIADESAKLQVDKAKAVEEEKTAEQDFELYEEKYQAAETKQTSYEASSQDVLKRFANAFLSPIAGGNVFDTEGDVRRAQEAREEKSS